MTIETIINQANQMDNTSFANWCYENGIEYMNDTVDVYTAGQENEIFEVDVWFENYFLVVRYTIDGRMIRYELDE